MDTNAAMLLVLGGGIALALYAAWRANEVFCIAIERGGPRVVRGRPPSGFLDDVREIAAHAERGTVRAVKRSGMPVLVVAGLDERTSQRLVNTFSTYATTIHRGRARSRL